MPVPEQGDHCGEREAIPGDGDGSITSRIALSARGSKPHMTTVTSEKPRPSFQFVVTSCSARACHCLLIMRCRALCIYQRGSERIVVGQYGHQLAGRIDKGRLVGKIQELDGRGDIRSSGPRLCAQPGYGDDIVIGLRIQ